MFGNVRGFIGAFSTAALDAAGGREGCLASCLLRRRMRQRGLESLFESGPAVSGVLSAAASDAAAGPRKVGWRRVCCGAECGSGGRKAPATLSAAAPAAAGLRQAALCVV